MNKITAQKLIQLNYVFYQTIGEYFDSSRNYFWPGWLKLENLITQLAQSRELVKVLDLGCGNARFAEFLIKDILTEGFKYEGIEYSDFLFEKAESRLMKLWEIPLSKLIKEDLLLKNWKTKLEHNNYDLIVLFGVMHHIPSIQLREQLLTRILNLMNTNSIFIVTLWKFKNIPRLRRRILDRNSLKFKELLASYNINLDEFEQEDYILDWKRGRKAYRYCHYFSTVEATKLLEKMGFKIVNKFYEDAKESIVNEYLICKKK